MSNIKRINEYKRILRKLLDEEGFRGVKLHGNSYSMTGAINIHATVRLKIIFTIKGTDVILANDETGQMVKMNLADPTSIDAIKKIFNDDWQRIMNGDKKK